MILIKGCKRKWDDDDNYFDKMLRINKKHVTDESSDFQSCIAIGVAAMISNKKRKERKSR